MQVCCFVQKIYISKYTILKIYNIFIFPEKFMTLYFTHNIWFSSDRNENLCSYITYSILNKLTERYMRVCQFNPKLHFFEIQTSKNIFFYISKIFEPLCSGLCAFLWLIFSASTKKCIFIFIGSRFLLCEYVNFIYCHSHNECHAMLWREKCFFFVPSMFSTIFVWNWEVLFDDSASGNLLDFNVDTRSILMSKHFANVISFIRLNSIM